MARLSLAPCILLAVAACTGDGPPADGGAADSPAAAAPSAATGDATVVEPGVCPFECCTYGRWQARARVELRERPDSAAPAVATVAEGAVVQAVTGEVHVRPGVYVVARAFESFAAGDTLEVRSPLGEGFFRARRRGSADTLVSAGLGAPQPECPRDDPFCAGRFAREPAHTWWVRVRLPGGAEGWTAEAARSFRGPDACSGEQVPTADSAD